MKDTKVGSIPWLLMSIFFNMAVFSRLKLIELKDELIDLG